MRQRFISALAALALVTIGIVGFTATPANASCGSSRTVTFDSGVHSINNHEFVGTPAQVWSACSAGISAKTLKTADHSDAAFWVWIGPEHGGHFADSENGRDVCYGTSTLYQVQAHMDTYASNGTQYTILRGVNSGDFAGCGNWGTEQGNGPFGGSVVLVF